MERDYILLGMGSLSCFLHLITVIFGTLFYTLEGGPFTNLAGSLTTAYAIQFSPDNWIFPFWDSVLWIWLTLIFVYLGMNVFRDNKDGRMYCNPPLVTREVSALLSTSFILHLIWFFVWDLESLVGSAVVLFLLTISSWSAVILFTIRFWTATPFLFHHTRLDLWIYRILVQNGLAAYATWLTLEFLIKFGVTLTLVYENEEGDAFPTPSAISIILLNFILAIAFPLEMISWEKAVRYLLSPHLVIVWILSSIAYRLQNVPHRDETVRIYSLVLLIIATLILVTRSVNMVVRHFRNPLVPYV